MSALIIKDIYKTYSLGKTRIEALKDVSLNVEHAEYIAIAGPSGSGKTSLLNIIGLIDKPDSGTVVLRGTDTTATPLDGLSQLRRDLIGFVFQTFNLIPVLSVYENIEYPLIFSGLSHGERNKRVEEVLRIVDILELKDRRPYELSGGQRQRVSIARALVNNPEVIVADEPTANLDSRTGDSILSQMRELNRTLGVTFIFSSHDPLVLNAVERIYHLRDGMIRDSAA